MGGHLEAQSALQQAISLIQQAFGHGGTNEDGAGSAVWCNALLDQLLQNVPASCQLLVEDVCLHEICIHVHVGAEVKLLGDLFHQREGLVQSPSAVHELHKNGQGEVAW